MHNSCNNLLIHSAIIICRVEFEGVSQRVGKLGLDAAHQVKAEGLTRAARAASLGAQPSLDDCQQGLQEIG